MCNIYNNLTISIINCVNYNNELFFVYEIIKECINIILKDKLSDLLESWYGRPVHTDLVREQASDEEEEEKAKEIKPVKKWKKTEAS